MCLVGRRLPTRLRVRCDTMKLKAVFVCVWFCLCFGRQEGGMGGMVGRLCRKTAGVGGGLVRSSIMYMCANGAKRAAARWAAWVKAVTCA